MRYRIFKKNGFWLPGICLAVASLVYACGGGSGTTGQPPSFIIVFTDDQGYGDLGCYGSPNIRTPHIDQMAAEGMRFTSFYAAPFCAPSRTQLMTGCYPARAGLARNPRPSSPFGLHPDEITIAEVLKQTGYATKCIGKWHLGDAPGFLPTSQGFDSYFGLPFSNDMWRYHPRMHPREDDDSLMLAIRKRAEYTGYSGRGSYYRPGGGFPNDLPLMVDEEVIEQNPDQRQLTTRYTEEAIRFIREQKDRPFFLYLAHNMPHVPLFVPDNIAGKSFRGLYGDVMIDIDRSLGEIMDCLKELKLDENTLVVFASDNGPWLSYGIDGGSAGPLRDGKGSVYEGGIRVPGIFRWPGKIPAGSRTEVMAGTLDLLPTFAGLAGAEVPSDRTIDGRDLWPVLSGTSEKSPHDFFHYLDGSREGTANYKGIRDERWKLLVNIDPNGKMTGRELYDLGADVSERYNRIEQHPEIAARLCGEAQQFYDALIQDIRKTGHRED